ncbi:MAG: type II 3-dehydroquinate dehydratase [Bacilli bacterium]
MNILIINGPNLNLLGIREPNVYGTSSYPDLISFLNEVAKKLNINIEVFQSNHEGAIIDKLHEAFSQKIHGVVINPGALTHYSYAIRDAVRAISIPTVEVHLSDISNREPWRNISVIKEVCKKQFFGKGFLSYQEGLEFLIGEINGTCQ